MQAYTIDEWTYGALDIADITGLDMHAVRRSCCTRLCSLWPNLYSTLGGRRHAYPLCTHGIQQCEWENRKQTKLSSDSCLPAVARWHVTYALLGMHWDHFSAFTRRRHLSFVSSLISNKLLWKDPQTCSKMQQNTSTTYIYSESTWGKTDIQPRRRGRVRKGNGVTTLR